MIKRVILLLTVIALAACAQGLPGPDSTATANTVASDVTPVLDLSQARQRWQALNASGYRYLLKRQCFCLPAYTRPMWITVADGKVVAARYADDQSPVPKKVLVQLETIEQWFAQIAKAQTKSYHRVVAEFDGERGFPRQLLLDRSERMADDEISITISELQLLEPR